MAGTVVKIGPGVEGFSVGDQVFAMADNTYAEFCVVKATVLAKVPKGLDLISARCLDRYVFAVDGSDIIEAAFFVSHGDQSSVAVRSKIFIPKIGEASPSSRQDARGRGDNANHRKKRNEQGSDSFHLGCSLCASPFALLNLLSFICSIWLSPQLARSTPPAAVINKLPARIK